MSRTGLDPTTLAASLRRMAGDGSVEWVTEPMQTRVLLDVADLLAENAKLREHIASFKELSQDMVIYAGQNMKRHFAKRLRKLGVPL